MDKLIDQILQLVYSYDLSTIRELWSHFENKLFSKLDQDISFGLLYILVIIIKIIIINIVLSFSAVKKLENSLLKFYLIHALTNNRSDKVNEFLTKMTSDLQMQNEWKDWFSKIILINCMPNNLVFNYNIFVLKCYHT